MFKDKSENKIVPYDSVPFSAEIAHKNYEFYLRITNSESGRVVMNSIKAYVGNKDSDGMIDPKYVQMCWHDKRNANICVNINFLQPQLEFKSEIKAFMNHRLSYLKSSNVGVAK